ncbi:hypothetical protein ACQP1O_19340 [Nocardia sp. CA-151230]|uniref:hypothetical protein n=1 Tax=Nocardia sp. CA-151230 TaxID=3239982 RepID=UPI003D8AA13C
MNSRSTSVLATFTTAAVIGGLATCVNASADPAPAAPPADSAPVAYHATPTGDSVTTTLDGGTFALSPDGASVLVRDVAGQVLDSLPSAVRVDGRQIGLTQQISGDGRSLVSTPDWEAVRHQEIKPVASPVENQLAMNDLINSVSIGTSIGTMVGTAIGAALGVGVGVAIAGASCLVISLGCVVAVLPIVTLVGGVGGLVGAIVGGGPTAAAAAFDYITVLRSAPGESKYGQYARDRGAVPTPTPDAAPAPDAEATR